MNRITHGPAWLEAVAILLVGTPWREIASSLFDVLVIALVTFATFCTVKAWLFSVILLAFPQFRS